MTAISRRKSPQAEVEDAILALASRQHGVVTRTQLQQAGIRRCTVDRRVSAGRLRLLHRCVYLVGPLFIPRAREMAAALACGESAVVSHLSAAWLWPVLPDRDGSAPIEIILRHGNRSRSGVRIRRIRTLRPDEATRLEGIPITTPARTLYDLASSVGSRELERAVTAALAQRLTSRSEILALLNRHGPRGTAGLRSLVEAEPGPVRTRSLAEEHFLALIREGQLPVPEINVVLRGYEVDFFWRGAGLVAEMDGFAFHSSRVAFEGDRRRDAALAAAGLRVMRVTWRQLQSEPKAVLARLAGALARAQAAV